MWSQASAMRTAITVRRIAKIPATVHLVGSSQSDWSPIIRFRNSVRILKRHFYRSARQKMQALYDHSGDLRSSVLRRTRSTQRRRSLFPLCGHEVGRFDNGEFPVKIHFSEENAAHKSPFRRRRITFLLRFCRFKRPLWSESEVSP